MHNPLLWLGLSLFLVAVCLVAVLLVAIPVIQELSRTARSAEKLLDMLSRELPPTLQSLRSTGDELSELSEQVNEGVRSASQVVTQVDQGLETVRTQAESVKRGSLSLFTGLRAAWQAWQNPDRESEEEYYASSPYGSYREDDWESHPESIPQEPGEKTQVPSPLEQSGEPGQTGLRQAAQGQALPSLENIELNSATSVANANRQTSEEQV